MIEFNDGVHLKETSIWLDATKKKNLSFLSNPLSTNFLRHSKVITTPQTHKLLERKLAAVNVLPCPYNRMFNLGNIEFEFLPSGFILGS
ncbi:MAG: MBL fold metallo-hydrolase, partial [Candidatus Dadabacteria bacterium]|nr:MBL fold metallo-hydrolase [Candidatus Dadabacteria bacterium]NIS07440.1 MBL fold metallo-hydrolase [Candidatus Dadabacteria bacterium]NIY21092.1 MBL fold metallo-hydrolase [Candidatus Dadabacteria bacterium]